MPDSGPPLAPNGGGPHDPGMEARVSVLENDVKDIKADLRRIMVDIAEIKGRVSQMPTSVQLLFMQAGLIVTLFGAAFALLKLAGH
ncbi:MAG: hypothetical protein AB7T18_08655 [Alphaproteobacteria bacterium]